MSPLGIVCYDLMEKRKMWIIAVEIIDFEER